MRQREAVQSLGFTVHSLVRSKPCSIQGALLQLLTAESGTQPKVGRAAREGPHLGIDRTHGSAAREALSPSALT